MFSWICLARVKCKRDTVHRCSEEKWKWGNYRNLTNIKVLPDTIDISGPPSNLKPSWIMKPITLGTCVRKMMGHKLTSHIYIYIWSAKQPWFLAVSGNAQEIHGFLTKDKKCGLKRRKPNSAWRSFRSNWALARSGTLKFDGGTPATMANYGTMGSKWDIWLDVGFFCLIQLESQGIWETSRVGEWHSHLFLGSLFGKDNRWNAELAAAHFLCFRNLTEVVLELVRHDLNMHFMQATTRITWLYVLTGVQVDMQIIFRVMIGVWFVPSCFEPVCVLESLKDWWRKEWLASIGPIVEAMSSMCAFEMEAFSEQATRTVDEWLLVVCFRLLFIVPPVSRSNHIGHPMTQYNY